MFNMLPRIGLLLAVYAGVSALPSSPELPAAPETRDTSSTFSLFAYGSKSHTEIGGFPIFYNNGYAYIADPAKVNYTEEYVVMSHGTADTTEWVAEAKMGTNMTWANSLFYVPTPSGPTGFYKEGISTISNSSIITTGFTFYGMTAMLKINGRLYTEWYAVPTRIDGLWSVGWNATAGLSDSSESELISVRQVNPPNVPFPNMPRQLT